MLPAYVEGGVCAPRGFVAGGTRCGIRKNHNKKDLALIYSQAPCAAAAVYTQNKVFGAPIMVTRRNLHDGFAQAVICNSGNANTCTADGLEKAQRMCDVAAAALGILPDDVIVASTGVIGQSLDVELIERGVAQLAPALSVEGAHAAAQAIMTTDLEVKERAVRFELDGKSVTIGSIAKGSGMIHPNMATMLSFITTDAAITPAMLGLALKNVVADTFNMISVDGDTSTNDMVSIMANGMAGNDLIDCEGEGFASFTAALRAIAVEQARLIARDGEGATRLLECNVTGAPDQATAKSIAKSVIKSSLVKAAMFGADANWGRILCAIGYSEGAFRVETIDVYFQSIAGRIQVCRDGAGVHFSEETAKAVLQADEIRIDVDMKQGSSAAAAWGCDLTYDYVKINGDYRT
jgi:glutamate N-acetyltransferase/amino-acid N-acetyltransferase